MKYHIKTIADVVTGQVDVRNVVIPNYEKDDDADDDLEQESNDEMEDLGDLEEEV